MDAISSRPAPDPSPTMMRGAKVRLYPNKRQARVMDLWRRRGISLWNLLLSLEQAAYSSENVRSKLGWRQIWATVVEERHASAVDAYKHGKQRKNGTFRKESGVGREEERQALKERLTTLRKGSREHNAVKEALNLIAPTPMPLDPAMLAKIRREAVDIDPETGEALSAKLFIWLDEMQMIMARLKQVPRTAWIDDLPSHAAQAIVKDLIKALNNMLREREKRLSGGDGRDTGFPRFKKSRYAAGSVYFANTQMFFDAERKHVKLPNGVGNVRCDALDLDLRILDEAGNDTGKQRNRVTGSIPKNAKLMGGRIWRQGEDWYLSCQWEMKRPDPLPKTERTAGVKIAGNVLLTTYDDRGQTREYTMPPPDQTLVIKQIELGRRQSRILEGEKARRKKKLSNGYSERRAKRLAASGKKDLPLRMAKPVDYFKTASELARIAAIESNRRDGFLHELTTKIVRKFDEISIQKMDVADMMKKKKQGKRLRRHEQREAEAKKVKKANGAAAAAAAARRPRPMKPVRKLLSHVAMGRTRQLLEYKYRDLRPGGYHEIDRLDPQAQACSRCGTIHPEMKDGRRMMKCDAIFADGSVCNNNLLRHRNAARNAERPLLLARQAKAKAEKGRD